VLVQLPNNESAILREYDELTERQARRIRGALRGALEQAGSLASAGFDENDPNTWGVLKNLGDEGTAIEEYQDRCIVEMVKSWTLGDLPTMDSVGDLPTETYATLAEAAVAATRDENASTLENVTDPKAPTESLNVSAPTSPVVVSNQLTPTSPTVGESTATAP
jgi:hypothetical protein